MTNFKKNLVLGVASAVLAIGLNISANAGDWQEEIEGVAFEHYYNADYDFMADGNAHGCTGEITTVEYEEGGTEEYYFNNDCLSKVLTFYVENYSEDVCSAYPDVKLNVCKAKYAREMGAVIYEVKEAITNGHY